MRSPRRRLALGVMAGVRTPGRRIATRVAVSIGLASVVSGDAEPTDAIRSVVEVPHLQLMACGHRPSNPSELLSSEQFADVLQLLRDHAPDHVGRSARRERPDLRRPAPARCGWRRWR